MVTTVFTLEDLRRILREGAGEDVDLDSNILDTSFEDLGYESLALLETGVRLGREYGIELDDATLTDIETPREFIAAVNEQIGRLAQATV
ncbi:acyl carrier protein [Streptomyces laurentii]|uniref:acyl carrier protein n=1 Tax=Streptomyces laurentii TaxID=39478 RepID=UPI0036B5BABF